MKKFKIGNALPVPERPKSLYKLVISNMSGDADHYEEVDAFFYKNEEPVLSDIIELCELSQKDWPSREEIEVAYRNLEKKHAKYFETSEDLITQDITNCDVMCRPGVSKLTWFDKDGNEHYVTYK